MMVFIARALCPALYGIGSSTSSFESLSLRKTKRSQKMSKDIFLFFTPTRKLAYKRRCKEQNVLRSSLLRSAVWKRPRGERMGKTSKAKSIPSSTQHLRVSLLTGVGVSPRNSARLKLYCYNVVKI